MINSDKFVSAIFNFIWRQNTALGDFFGDNILFIKNYFVLLSINGAGKKHRLLERFKNTNFLLITFEKLDFSLMSLGTTLGT
jgi:hypothetical protein